MKNKICSHLVCYYPDREKSLKFAKALIDGGSSYLEVQFPFSDPIADGIAIQTASTIAIKSGFTLENGFKFIERVKRYSSIPIFLMTYGNIVYHNSVENFCKRSLDAGASGLIVPDLPIGNDEKLFEYSEKYNVPAIPVLFPSMSDKRILLVKNILSEYIYVALRQGITGIYTEIGKDNIDFLKIVRKMNKKILAGFGISTIKQVEAITPYAEAAVVGSAYIKLIKEKFDSGKIKEKVKELVCFPK